MPTPPPSYVHKEANYRSSGGQTPILVWAYSLQLLQLVAQSIQPVAPLPVTMTLIK
jgi:hypothetical protein